MMIRVDGFAGGLDILVPPGRSVQEWLGLGLGYSGSLHCLGGF